MIYLELVPRDLSVFHEQSKWALSTYSDINAINVPDVLRLKNRSYVVSIELAQRSIDTIPHIRAIDFSELDLINLCQLLIKKNVTKILLISGDLPSNPLQPVFKHNLIQIISLIKKEVPSLDIYAGCDPYRQSFQAEIDYSMQKINAGAKGLFTQPIFNPHLAYLLLEQCLPCEWFIGAAPVLTDNSKNYWESRNNVVFPPTFKTTLTYNVSITKDIIQLTKESNQHNYLMPIKVDISQYLAGVFSNNAV